MDSGCESCQSVASGRGSLESGVESGCGCGVVIDEIRNTWLWIRIQGVELGMWQCGMELGCDSKLKCCDTGTLVLQILERMPFL